MSQEFIQSLQWGSAAFVCGILLREYAVDATGKWLGRAGVLVAFFSMSAFGLHSARQCSVLINLVERSNANPVSNQTGFVAVEKEYRIDDGKGLTVSWTKFSDGGARPVSIRAGCDSVNDGVNSFADSIAAGPDGTSGNLSSGKSF